MIDEQRESVLLLLTSSEQCSTCQQKPNWCCWPYTFAHPAAHPAAHRKLRTELYPGPVPHATSSSRIRPGKSHKWVNSKTCVLFYGVARAGYTFLYSYPTSCYENLLMHTMHTQTGEKVEKKKVVWARASERIKQEDKKQHVKMRIVQ